MYNVRKPYPMTPMYALSSHLILVFIGIIILLEGFVLFVHIGDKKTGVFAIIYGIFVIGYGLYLRIAAKDPSVLTEKQTQLIKLLYGISGFTMFLGAISVTSMFILVSHPPSYKLKTTDTKDVEIVQGVVELGNLQLTMSYMHKTKHYPILSYIENTASFKNICQRYFVFEPTNTDETIRSDKFEDYIAAFCETHVKSLNRIKTPVTIVRDASFKQLLLAFDTLYGNVILLRQFYDVVEQIAVASVEVIESTPITAALSSNILATLPATLDFIDIALKLRRQEDNNEDDDAKIQYDDDLKKEYEHDRIDENQSYAAMLNVCEKWKQNEQTTQFEAMDFIIELCTAAMSVSEVQFDPQYVLQKWAKHFENVHQILVWFTDVVETDSKLRVKKWDADGIKIQIQ